MLSLGSYWKGAYNLEKRRIECVEIVNLRTMTYKVCKELNLEQHLSKELQYELELIGEQVY